jgi:DNA-directed RNA polymerase specialized sigma24 family protein
MASAQSVTQWLDQFRRGDPAAAQDLWERYFARLVRLARQKLLGRPLRVADAEDVALSAFKSFCQGVRAGRFPQLADRYDLWRLLVAITAHKALRTVRDEGRQKRCPPRGGGTPAVGQPKETALDQIAGREPTPEFAALVAEQCRRLLGKLESKQLEQIALWKMEGFTNAEIAARLGVALRTVERKLRLIRALWEEAGREEGVPEV